MDIRLTWTDCDEAGDYVVPNVLSPRDLVARPDNMYENCTTHSGWAKTYRDSLGKPADQVWGISENRDKSYRSNARPHLTLAGLPSLVSYPTTASLF